MAKINIKKEKGQSLIIVAFGIITLVGFVGLAVDLGSSYVERIRIRRAADAAALAAAAELPLEEVSHIRALEFLEENNYGCGLEVNAAASGYHCTQNDTVRVEIDNNYLSGPAEDDAERIIRINTIDYRDPDNPYLPDSADRIRVEITSDASVFFMRVFGFLNVPVSASATAENINHLDVALVFDDSGSMEFDTLCYGCWRPSSSTSYPDGNFYPLPWDGDLDGQPDHCEGNSAYSYDGKKYIIIEAEEYSYTNNSYSRDLYTTGFTYWVIQRNGLYHSSSSYLGRADSFGRDDEGGYIQHQPPRTHIGADGTGVPCSWDDINDGGMCLRSADISSWGGPFPAPRVDYDFTVPSNGTWYVWVRGQGGDSQSADYVFWGLDGSPIGTGEVYKNNYGGYQDGASRSDWEFVRFGCGESGSQPCGQYLQKNRTYTLNLWAGANGFRVDRLIITNDSRDPNSFFSSSNDSSARSSYRGVVDNVLKTPATGRIDNNRTGWACDPCDARFGGSPSPSDPRRPVCTSEMAPQPNRLLDDIYDDEYPMRPSVEAAKNFVRRLDPRYDQIGYIAYNSSASIRDRLQCVRRLGADTCAYGYDPDPDTSDGLSSDVIESSVIAHLDATHATGGTNIADGIQKGIEVLSSRNGNYGRPGAAHIMIVMTDGRTNSTNNLDTPECYEDDLWPANDSGSTTWDRAKDCTVYYAMQARNNGIVIYSITLGSSADIELMEYIAELTGGVHRNAPRPEQLNDIFDELYKRIFLRLVE